MVITLDTTDPRASRALALLPQARTWTRGTRKADGRPFYIAPASKPGAVYFVDAAGAECTCPDRETCRVVCKHMTAARLLLVERGEAQPAPTPKRATCDVCTQLLAPGVLAGMCADCVEAGLLFEGVAAIKGLFGSRQGAVVETIGA